MNEINAKIRQKSHNLSMSSSAPFHHRASVESFYHKTKRHEARTDRRLDPFGVATQFKEAAHNEGLFFEQPKTDSVITMRLTCDGT